ncbi:MAG: [NiFe]-hydrogenase assembly chaperone HybE [Woeseiaceae bacterium]
MTEMANAVADLVRQFENIYVEHMQDLPIVNPRVQVEAVGFQKFGVHQLGVLITPWFMNLILLPGSEEWSTTAQGDTSVIEFPSGPMEFTSCHDASIGTYLSAVLFRSVSDLSDQPMAVELARQVMNNLFLEGHVKGRLSRRELLTGLRTR